MRTYEIAPTTPFQIEHSSNYTKFEHSSNYTNFYHVNFRYFKYLLTEILARGACHGRPFYDIKIGGLVRMVGLMYCCNKQRGHPLIVLLFLGNLPFKFYGVTLRSKLCHELRALDPRTKLASPNLAICLLLRLNVSLLCWSLVNLEGGVSGCPRATVACTRITSPEGIYYAGVVNPVLHGMTPHTGVCALCRVLIVWMGSFGFLLAL